jgi:hypothetical protein
MAYKKYIKKDGKIYGPYIYHSRRIDGKVISEYRGPSKLSYKKIFLAVFGVIFLAALIFFLVFSEKGITGEAVLDLDANYQQGSPLEGRLKLSLQEGELIPASSKLVFENNGNVFEYNLKDLISDEPAHGNFYIKGESVSGSGEGYGIAGRSETFPTVYFVLNILSEEESVAEQTTEPETTEAQQTETQETEASETENIIEPEPTETSETETAQEETPTTEAQTTEEITTESTEEQAQETETPQTEQTQEAPMTGNIISRFAGAISNFFLGLTMTGNVVVEFEKEVEGQVAAGKTFIYTLQEGERAEIKPRSVRTDSQQLSDDEVELRTEGSEVIVTTNYSEAAEGFGEEYLGSKNKELVIELSALNLILEQGDLKVSLVGSGNKILSLETLLEEGKVSANETISEKPISESEIPETNLTNENETGYETEKEIYVPELIVSLTEQERATLIKKFGNASVEVKETSKKGFITIKYELGEYQAEFNYDSNLSRETLELFKSRDMAKWLKDIAKSLSREPETEKEIREYTEKII